MLEFGVSVSTGELVALERALRGVDTDDARSALAKAHRAGLVLTLKEREAVLAALRSVEETPGAADGTGAGLAELASRLEREQADGVEPPAPPPQARRRPARK